MVDTVRKLLNKCRARTRGEEPKTGLETHPQRRACQGTTDFIRALNNNRDMVPAGLARDRKSVQSKWAEMGCATADQEVQGQRANSDEAEDEQMSEEEEEEENGARRMRSTTRRTRQARRRRT